MAIKTDMAIVTVLAININVVENIIGVSIIDIQPKEIRSFRSKRIGAPMGNLDGLMNPLVLTSLIV